MILIHAKGVYHSLRRCMDGDGLAIENGIIKERGSFEKLLSRYRKAPGLQILDYPEGYAMPGLINTHVHLEFTPGEHAYEIYMRESEAQHTENAWDHARQLLDSGVTTVRDLGSSMQLVHENSKLSKEDQKILPRLLLSGPPITEKNGHLAFLGGSAESEEELWEAVLQRRKAGCSCIKIIANGGQNTPGSVPEKDAYDETRIRMIVDLAHELQLPTAVHCLTSHVFAWSMRSQVDSIEHCACFVRKQPENWLERRFEPQIMEEFRGDSRWFMIGFSNHYHRLDLVREGRKQASLQESFLLEQEKKEAEIFQKLLALGLRPVIGTDAGFGFTYFNETWLELALLVERCGLSEEDVIHAGTVAGAQTLGIGTQVGQLAPGFDADVILVEKNPLKEIRTFEHVAHVIRKGELLR